VKRTGLLAMLIMGVFLFAAACYAGPRVYVVKKPPPPRLEVVGVAPSAAHVWIAGHWAWERGNYQWVPGHWAKRPRTGAAWVPGHWKQTRRGHVWIQGHWR
jgi:hypothetical protein